MLASFLLLDSTPSALPPSTSLSLWPPSICLSGNISRESGTEFTADPSFPSTAPLGSHKTDTPHLILQTGCLAPREVLWCGGPNGLGFRSQPYGFGQPSIPFFLVFLFNHFSFYFLLKSLLNLLQYCFCFLLCFGFLATRHVESWLPD